MEIVRIVVATGVFLGACFLIWDGLVSTPTGWALLVLAAFCFGLAYLIWPSRKRGQRDQEHPLLDVLEVVLELPVECLIWLIRGLGRLVSGKGVDIDF